MGGHATAAEVMTLLAELAGDLLHFEDFSEALEYRQSLAARTHARPAGNGMTELTVGQAAKFASVPLEVLRDLCEAPGRVVVAVGQPVADSTAPCSVSLTDRPDVGGARTVWCTCGRFQAPALISVEFHRAPRSG